MHKDYDATKQGKLDKQNATYITHAMAVFNGADNYTITDESDTIVTAERIDDGVKLTVIQDFTTFTHELLTAKILDAPKIPSK